MFSQKNLARKGLNSVSKKDNFLLSIWILWTMDNIFEKKALIWFLSIYMYLIYVLFNSYAWNIATGRDTFAHIHKIKTLIIRKGLFDFIRLEFSAPSANNYVHQLW